MRPARRTQSRGFTLVELLVVIAIISVLIAVLLPVVNSVQKRGRELKCQSNMRQVALALFNYAAENKGRFPTNAGYIRRIETPWDWEANYWCQRDRIGKYLPVIRLSYGNDDANSNLFKEITSPVLICPEDDGAARSYTMNFWASAVVDTYWEKVEAPNHPKFGQAWNTSTKGSSKLILLAETYSSRPFDWAWATAIPTTYQSGRTACSFAGNLHPVSSVPYWKPGRFFVGDLRMGLSGTPSPEMRFFRRETEIDWERHRRRADGGKYKWEARGRANFVFGDGHVESFRPDDLADRATGKSKFVALWSPRDEAMQRYAIGP